MVYVFDSSFVGALIIPDEKREKADEFYVSIGEYEEIFVPHLIWYEVGNIFKNLVRRKRYTYNETLDFIPKFAAIRLTGDTEQGAGYTETLLRLAMEYDLTAYDAAYLELAGRKKAVLCTMDEGLQKAAEGYGVITLQ